GKVTLTWETDEEDFEALLGYNIYRYTDRLESTYTNEDKNGNWVGGHWEIKGDTVIVNESVLESSEVKFTDYNVVPGTTYYYVIKQLTTSLNSHALSNAVAVTPLTAQKGDANGSMSVDVADVVTEVAYMSYQNPQPFIFEAADVNSDNKVNILDVVATVNIIRTPMTLNIDSENSTATYTIEDGILYIESDVAIGGIQLSIAAEKGTEFTPLEAITGFEQVGTWMSDSEYQFLVFSMSGKALAPGKHAILRIGEATLNDVILSNSRGANIMAVNGNTTGIGAVEGMQMRLPYPNPFSTTLTIPYIVGKDGSHNVSIVVSDIAGREVYRHAAVNSFGEYVHTWTPGTALANGLYIVSLYVDDALMQSAKVIYKK
ncbi:MAG: T9SS type A sorting domain-containing protein, partial [Bacteroidaceae bacterium]|nr:T9SS type A sorting domain-containing protein [Bacteroidaceae bacterium]